MRIALAALAIALLIGPTGLAQKKKPKPPAKAPLSPPAPLVSVLPATVTVGQVHDRRSDGSHFNRLELELLFPDVPAGDVAAVQTVVKSAADNTGRNLVPDDAGKGGLQPIQKRLGPEATEKPGPLQVTLTLKNPARMASTVTSASGEIELYMPGKDPLSVATIPKFASQTGKPLADPALKANGIEISVMGRDQLDAEKKRRVEKVRQEAKKRKMPADRLEELLADVSSEFLKPEEGDVVLLVRGPEGLILELAYLDAAGEEKRVSMSERQGFTLLSTWGEKPGPDWSLRVRMKTPKSLARYSFTLADVQLP